MSEKTPPNQPPHRPRPEGSQGNSDQPSPSTGGASGHDEHTGRPDHRPSTPPQQPSPGGRPAAARPPISRPPHGSALAGQGKPAQPRPPHYRPSAQGQAGPTSQGQVPQGPPAAGAGGQFAPEPVEEQGKEKKTIFGMGRVKLAAIALAVLLALIAIFFLIKMLLSSGGSGEKTPEKAAQSLEESLAKEGIPGAWKTLSAIDRNYANTLLTFAGSQLGEQRLAISEDGIDDLLSVFADVEITLTTDGREITELSDDVARISYDSFALKATYDPEALFAKISGKLTETMPWLIGDNADPRIGGRVEAALRGMVYDYSNATTELSGSAIGGPDPHDFTLIAVREDGGWQISPVMSNKANEWYYGTEAEENASQVGQWEPDNAPDAKDPGSAVGHFFTDLNEWATYCEADQAELATASLVKNLVPAEARLYAYLDSTVDGCEILTSFSAAAISSDSTWLEHQAGPMTIVSPDQVQINVLDNVPLLSDLLPGFVDVPGLYTAHETCLSGEARTMCAELPLIQTMIDTAQSLRTQLSLDYDRKLLGVATTEVGGDYRVSLAATRLAYKIPFAQFAEAYIANMLDNVKYGD